MKNVEDLSQLEKEKMISERKFLKSLGECCMGIIAGAVATTLFSLYMLGDFSAAFTAANAGITVARFVSPLALMLMMFVGVYRFSSKKEEATRNFWLTTIIVVIAFILSMVGGKLFNSYVMFCMLVALVLIELVGRRVATLGCATVGVLVIFSFMYASAFTNMVEIVSAAVCSVLSGLIVNFMAYKHYSRLKFLLLTIISPLVILPFVLMLTMMSGDYSMNMLWNVIGSYASNLISALLCMPIVALFEGMFNIADDFRLNELCNLDSPLLKRLASEAPGTFNHSLVVGNLAQACASAIGENPNMARCAAYYHDIGKLKAPLYFSENQSDYNPHDDLIPEVSVSMITSHTLFGEILARQNRLPSEIADICRQHHGTSKVGYFYRKALSLKEDGDVAVNKYTYAGPKPQTKIAAIIMIADTIEAAMRAYMPPTKEEYELRINKLVDEKLADNQFDECPITMKDIALIKKTIIEVLPSIHHKRVDYDKRKTPIEEAAESAEKEAAATTTTPQNN